jgi:uncharacterized RDD family membrane protein YckC
MKPMDRYIDDVMRHVFATQEDQDRLKNDLRSHFVEGEAAGREPRDIILSLGTPEEVAAAFNAEREFRYASFWERLFAFFGDCGILLIIILPVLALGLLGGVVGSEPNQLSLFWIFVCFLFFIALVGVGIFYFPLFESHYGKTPGKHLMRIRVRRENGALISLGQAFVRRLSFYFDMLWIDALFIPFTDKHQRALDIVAKTVVAREPGKRAGAGSYLLCALLLLMPVFCLLSLGLLFSQG